MNSNNVLFVVKLQGKQESNTKATFGFPLIMLSIYLQLGEVPQRINEKNTLFP